mgnify:CR=1 FL=1
MSERRPTLDLDAAMAALEGRPRSAPSPADGEELAQAASLPHRSPRKAVKGQASSTDAVTRSRTIKTNRVHMFSTRANAETLNALYALAREERRTVTELFEEAVGLLVSSRQRDGLGQPAAAD